MENWTVEETKKLFAAADGARAAGKGLKIAFETSARETGRKIGSVRNYYYAQLKTLSLLPEYSLKLGIKPEKSPKSSFALFSDGEVRDLVRQILIRRAAGESVRAVTASLSGGDKSLMLRLQNKYRSVIFHKRRYADGIISEMKGEKLTFFNPYTRRAVIDGEEEKSGGEAAVESANALLRNFFEAKNEVDKLSRLSEYMAELGKLLSDELKS